MSLNQRPLMESPASEQRDPHEHGCQSRLHRDYTSARLSVELDDIERDSPLDRFMATHR
jgi:hypothetical protein